jgi:hypothetical protein
MLPSIYIDMTEAVQESVQTGTAEVTELEDHRWAVISFDKVEGGNLTYEAASRLLADLDAKGVAGLCVVTDSVAARLAA